MLEKLTIQEFDDDKLVINNVEIAGWIDDDKCRFCKAQSGDPNCGFCKNRPHFPNKLWQQS